MATRADIEVNVKGLKKVQELSKLLDKVSGKVNQLNKGGGKSADKKSDADQRFGTNKALQPESQILPYPPALVYYHETEHSYSQVTQPTYSQTVPVMYPGIVMG